MYKTVFCINCGKDIRADAKFCDGCGKPVYIIKNSKTRKTVYDGEAHKCPYCGETLDSFSAFCPTCGEEIRGMESTDSIKEFQRKYELLRSNYDKIDLIRVFPIPNSKEDIAEFIFLAASNVDPKAYTRKLNTYLESSPAEISDAWLSKLEQAYVKAKLVIKDDPIFEAINEVYYTKKAELQAAKRDEQQKEKQKKREETRKSFKKVLIVGVAIVIVIGAIICVNAGRWSKESKLRKKINEVEKLAEAGEYDEAHSVANEIQYNDDNESLENKWDRERELIILKINSMESRESGQLMIPNIKTNGKTYSEVKEDYKAAGFINVKTEKVEGIESWFAKKGEIIEVIINGTTKYKEGDYVDEESEVIIRYKSNQ